VLAYNNNQPTNAPEMRKITKLFAAKVTVTFKDGQVFFEVPRGKRELKERLRQGLSDTVFNKCRRRRRIYRLSNE